jgi:hypothetical protein
MWYPDLRNVSSFIVREFENAGDTTLNSPKGKETLLFQTLGICKYALPQLLGALWKRPYACRPPNGLHCETSISKNWPFGTAHCLALKKLRIMNSGQCQQLLTAAARNGTFRETVPCWGGGGLEKLDANFCRTWHLYFFDCFFV